MVVVVANIMEKFKTNNTNADPFIRNTEDTNPAKFGHINAIVDAINQLQKGGEWIPSVSATNDAQAEVTAAFYQHTGGNVCQFSIAFDLQMDPTSNSTVITISNLPVPTTFTNGRQVIAAVNVGENGSEYVRCIPQSLENTIVLNVDSSSNGISLQGLAIVGHYLVLPLT